MFDQSENSIGTVGVYLSVNKISLRLSWQRGVENLLLTNTQTTLQELFLERSSQTNSKTQPSQKMRLESIIRRRLENLRASCFSYSKNSARWQPICSTHLIIATGISSTSTIGILQTRKIIGSMAPISTTSRIFGLSFRCPKFGRRFTLASSPSQTNCTFAIASGDLESEPLLSGMPSDASHF